FGPRGLDSEPFPLPLAAITASPMIATDVGYHPAGIRPASLSSPRAVATLDVAADRLKTPTAFASASATNRRDPSAESAIAFGVAPSFGPAGGGSSNRAITRCVFVSTTAT